MKRNKRGQFMGGKGYWTNKKNPHKESTKIKISNSLKGKIPKNINLIKGYWSGKKRPNLHTEKTRKRLSELRKGSNSHLWKGGITTINKTIRNSVDYKLWRESVFKRDNWVCVHCNQRGGKLEVDHIKPFAHYPELRFDINNGRTLCKECHQKTDTYLRKKKKKAFITGCTGQDGSYLIEFLLRHNYEVHGLIRRTAQPNTQNIRHLLYDEDIFNKKFFLHDGDLMDQSSLLRIISQVQPDEIYNLGAMAGVSPSFKQPDYAIETNGNVVGRILEIIKFVNPRIKFFQAGSSHIFGDTKETPQNEETKHQPISPYALGKSLAVQTVKYYREVHGLFACSGIFYAHVSPRYSESFLLGKIIHSIWRIQKGEQSFMELGNLEVPSEYGYAKDFVKAAWQMLQLEKPDDFIISTNELYTPREFIELAFEEAGLEREKYIRINENLKRPSEVGILTGDYSKANKVFGYKPEISFKDLVKIMVKGNDQQIQISKSITSTYEK